MGVGVVVGVRVGVGGGVSGRQGRRAAPPFERRGKLLAEATVLMRGDETIKVGAGGFGGPTGASPVAEVAPTADTERQLGFDPHFDNSEGSITNEEPTPDWEMAMSRMPGCLMSISHTHSAL